MHRTSPDTGAVGDVSETSPGAKKNPRKRTAPLPGRVSMVIKRLELPLDDAVGDAIAVNIQQ